MSEDIDTDALDATVIGYLNGRPDMSEAAVVRNYTVAFDGSLEIAIRVIDRGPDSGNIRFSAEAYPPGFNMERPMEFDFPHKIANAGPVLTDVLGDLNLSQLAKRIGDFYDDNPIYPPTRD